MTASMQDRLDTFPRHRLATLPTPLEPLPRLSERAGTGIWSKRDDLTGLAFGGNKVRKLEYLLGAARAEGCDTVVTFGALQSNHARQTAAACARAGLHCELVLTTAVPRGGDGPGGAAYDAGGNVLLDHLLGATVTVVPNNDDAMAAAVTAVRQRVAARGGRARWVPPGGSDAVGTLGYVGAGLELAAQLRDLPRPAAAVVLAVSTGGTLAGLLTGLRGAGCAVPVLGVDVYRPAERTRPAVRELLDGVTELLSATAPADDEVHLDDRFLGPGYGIPTEAMREAVELAARTEGLLLDPVYSGKAMAALLAWGRSGRFGDDGPVVFLHTGGAPGLFAYPDLVDDAG
ncbi:MAG: D-cysteine desulfhydrase family protein [Microthrixaceae bacterium]